MTLDHAKLIARDWHEVEKLHKIMRDAAAGIFIGVGLEHEPDNRCCKQEPWLDTVNILTPANARFFMAEMPVTPEQAQAIADELQGDEAT